MPTSHNLRVALGGDHAGFPLKKAVAERYESLLTSLIDCGTHSEASCDYPEFAVSVSKAIIDGDADRGIVVWYDPDKVYESLAKSLIVDDATVLVYIMPF